MSVAACTAVTKAPQDLATPLPKTVVAAPVAPLSTQSTGASTIPPIAKDPCTAANAQEAWIALDNNKPILGPLLRTEVYYSSQASKLLAVAQQRRDAYGESRTYVEVSAELAERGSRVGTFSQVIATRPTFAEPADLFSSLPPYWQQQIEDPQAILVIKHYLLAKGAPGYVKYENDIVSDVSTKLSEGLELRCRSGEACRCL